ncbi:hypothetical protein JN535_05330 [Cellulosimicrobium cellulans]|uniref:hypothetical protein n=1 Tax=Cellulosimicrobium cellulans TaxID=1710 RepID=UPI001964D08C|nr:hypothetical protein [Cellulosimicrobium cellulans]MBN0039598.1 hypothetical protein [Cellulosimicrobium cellulans]
MTTADEALSKILELDGAMAVAVVDYGSGLALVQKQLVMFDLELAAAANTEVIRAKLRAIEQLGLNDRIEDILITLGNQYHLIRLSQRESLQGTFTYLVLERGRANLALARRALAVLDETITL